MRLVKRIIDTFPYTGRFYKHVEPDYSLPLDERDEDEDELVLETECDIQEVSKAANPVLIATFSVFFPWDVSVDLPLVRGMRFVGMMNSIQVEGMITNVVVSQLDGVVVYVKDYYAEQ